MRSRNRTIDIFNISMLDVISGALGAFLLIMLILMRFYEPNVVAELNAMQKEMAQAQETMKEAQQRQEAAEEALAKATSRAQDLEQRLGIALKETEVVFVVDISGSMVDNDGIQGLSAEDEDRWTQVKWGLYMLVATMSDQYSIDIVHFPDGDGPFGAMFGELRQVTDALKRDVHRNLQALDRKIGGRAGTTTGDTMTMVLGPQYQAAKTVVLLSDGEPGGTFGGSYTILSPSQMAALVEQLTQANGGGKTKTINTIGVGENFRVGNAASAGAVVFLRSLAERNGGFYIGY
jgi:hypothetical protein